MSLSQARARGALLWRFLLLSWLAVLLNLAGLLSRAPWSEALVDGYTLVVYLTYGLFYLAPVFVMLWVLHLALSVAAVERLGRRLQLAAGALLAVLAIAGTAAVQLALHADLVIVRLFGFHLNGFVWNLLTTPGGIDSLDASGSSQRSFALLVAGFVALQAALYLVAARSRSLARWIPQPPRWRRRFALAAVGVLLSASERLTFAVSNLTEHRPVLVAAETFPLYQTLYWRRLGQLLGISKHHDASLLDVDADAPLDYPRAPLERAPGSRDWNVLWLVAESLRADALDPEIMPATSAFAERATRFDRHYSSGNGTRMGLFGMFFGLYGNSWFRMLAAERGPVLMDVLLDAGYDVQAYTSAAFTYPEFDRTIFARVPVEQLHEAGHGPPGWENDRRQVGALLASLDSRPAERPFFRFMFFESPHAPYDFPPDAIVRPDYLEDLDYITLDDDVPIEPVRNRYLNACHHLDTQFARVFAGLEERGLLDSTIVIVTGDHGEEFREHGHWGHNSAFTDAQTRTPLLLYVPGRTPARVTGLSSHLDLPATLLALLGVTTPSEAYSLGHDLFGPVERERCVISSWDEMAIVDSRTKTVLPYRGAGLSTGQLFGADDEPLGDEGAIDPARVRDALADMSRFVK